MQQARSFPDRVTRGFAALGRDINTSRRRHRNTAADMAERAGVSLKTYRAIERGSPSVSIGAYAMVLYALGLEQPLFQLAAPDRDSGALARSLENLPQRVVQHRRRRSDTADCVSQDMDDGVF